MKQNLFSVDEAKTLGELEAESSNRFRNEDHVSINPFVQGLIKTMHEMETESTKGFRNED